ncbi:MAG TPA: CoA transferase [Gemmatales bacterium]|nr:CoA transferase [Gemmatales bacterium]
MFPKDAAPLHGVRVLDASRVLAGPFCGMLLADLGADVIKLERPTSPDETRTWGPPFHDDYAAYFLSCNRSKQAITLDLGQPEGRTVFDRLVAQSDVLLHNFLPPSASKLGLTPTRLHDLNPRLVIGAISGYGQTGPWAERPGYDFALQAESGLMSITGPVDGPPFKVGVAISDILAGLYTALSATACLHARQQSGHGYTCDIALFDCSLAAQVNVVQAYLTGGQVPKRQGNAHLQIVPYQLFATADSHLVLAIGNDAQWQRFCRAVERHDLADEAHYRTNPSRVRHRAELIPEVAAILRGRRTSEWEQVLKAADIPHAAVLDYAQLFELDQTAARGMKVTVRDPEGKPVDLVGSPFKIAGATLPTPRMPPRVGADTDRILGELLGYTAEQLADLRSRGVI